MRPESSEERAGERPAEPEHGLMDGSDAIRGATRTTQRGSRGEVRAQAVEKRDEGGKISEYRPGVRPGHGPGAERRAANKHETHHRGPSVFKQSEAHRRPAARLVQAPCVRLADAAVGERAEPSVPVRGGFPFVHDAKAIHHRKCAR